LVLGVTPSAYADDAPNEVAATAATAAIAEGVREVPVAPSVRGADTIVATTFKVQNAAAEVSTISLPVAPSGKVKIGSSSDQTPAVSIGLPTTGDHENAQVARDGTVVYQDSTGNVDIAAQPLQDGSVRIQAVLNDAAAPTEYSYRLGLPAGAVARLTQDGGVDILSPQQVINSIAPAWARDADGKAVPTRYELRGSDLVQVVEHTNGGFSYPITADPWWNTALKIAQCAAAVVYVALTTVFLVGKALKIVRAVSAARKWVASVGGANAAARLIVGASSAAERARLLASARAVAGASVLDFFGITQIRSACF